MPAKWSPARQMVAGFSWRAAMPRRMGLRPDHHHEGGVGMDLRELEPASLKRIREQDVSPRDIRWLVHVDVERAALEERWGAPEIVHDDFAEWFCFAFSPAEGGDVHPAAAGGPCSRGRICPQRDQGALLPGGCRADCPGPGHSWCADHSHERRSHLVASDAPGAGLPFPGMAALDAWVVTHGWWRRIAARVLLGQGSPSSCGFQRPGCEGTDWGARSREDGVRIVSDSGRLRGEAVGAISPQSLQPELDLGVMGTWPGLRRCSGSPDTCVVHVLGPGMRAVS